MIYVCVPVHNEARTVGLVLWKVRQVFTAFEREYQIIACDDASTDGSADVLTSYARVLPLTVIQHRSRQGYAKSLEELLRLALQRTDRPKRDCAITLHADFVHSPERMEDMVKHLESGADLVVAELVEQRGRVSRAQGLVRRWTPRLLRVAGLRDTVSGFLALRLIVLRQALRRDTAQFLQTEGWCASAELVARLAPHARRLDAIPDRRTPGVRSAIRTLQRRHGHDAGRGDRYDPRSRGGPFRVPDRRRRAVVPYPPEPRVVGRSSRLPLAPVFESNRGKRQDMGTEIRDLPGLRVLPGSRS